jgi:hypothetical protein
MKMPSHMNLHAFFRVRQPFGWLMGAAEDSSKARFVHATGA